MSAEPVIAFGQQPCGFFPRRFLVAKIRTARRLQAEIGGRVVYFCHDSDHDPRETRNVRVARRFTALWGVFAVAFALFAGFAENLIEAINILGSIFYGVLLGLFLVAFFLRRVGGSAVFFAAVIAQVLVIVMYFSLNIGYLWYNLIGCATCIALSVVLQAVLPPRTRADG